GVFLHLLAARHGHPLLGAASDESLIQTTGIFRMADLVASRLSAAELYGNPVTFMGAPYGHDLARVKAAILGVPFDCGTHAFRIGARQGPQAIREQSRLVR